MISRFRQYAREHGLRAAVAKTAEELRRRAFSENGITTLLKDLDDVKVPKKAVDLEVVPLTPDHVAGLAELNRKRGRPGVDKRFAAELERGIEGFVGLRGGAVVGYYWWVGADRAATHPDMAWLGPFLQIEPGDAYGSDFYMLPDARGGGLANAFLCGVETSLAARGFARLWGYVESGNREARWLYSSRGYRPIRDLTARTVFSRRRAAPKPKVGSDAP
jgi:GNAT superfamily N-acetyltransferase